METTKVISPLPKALLDDFRNYLYVLWKALGLPNPTPAQYAIAYYMQHGPLREGPEALSLIIEAFRGVGKSYVAAGFTLWNLENNRDVKVFVVSANKARADEFSNFVHRCINELPLCQHLKPGRDKRWSNIAFDVDGALPSGSPSVKSVGITGQLTGSRADIIIADDVETPKNSATQEQREKLSELVKEFDSVLKPGGKVIYLGTPQTEMSLYNTLVHRGYIPFIWPVEYPSLAAIKQRYGDKLAPQLVAHITKHPEDVGKPTDPARFNEVEIAKRKLSYGASGFALQFMLDTSLSDAERHPLRTRDFIVMSCDRSTGPERIIYGVFDDIKNLPNVGLPGDKWYAPAEVQGRANYQGVILAIDPSGRPAFVYDCGHYKKCL